MTQELANRGNMSRESPPTSLGQQFPNGDDFAHEDLWKCLEHFVVTTGGVLFRILQCIGQPSPLRIIETRSQCHSQLP